MKVRTLLFPVVFLIILIVFAELLLRLVLLFYGYPFFRPSDYIYKGFYKELEPIARKEIRNDDAVKDILILGGSVVSSPWSHLESRLDTILLKNYPDGSEFAIYNAAVASHTSLDNRIKYDLLSRQRFDLVIYYEAINENRANNIPLQDFRADYSHIKWYSDSELLQAHPEINVTVIPYLVHKIAKAIKDRLTHQKYISREEVYPEFVQYGDSIKTASSFRKNIGDIVTTATKRGDPLLLLTYASYFPKNVTLTGQKSDTQYFACCYFSSPVTTWGSPTNVKKGIEVHNRVLREIARENQVILLPMDTRMPQDSAYFRDVCHFSETGANYFSHALVKFIVKNKLLK